MRLLQYAVDCHLPIRRRGLQSSPLSQFRHMQINPSTRLHAEFSLEFLIERAAIKAGVPIRRLNAIENLLMLLTRQWRVDVPIRPQHELRMSGDTRDRLVACITEVGNLDDRTLERIAVYRGDQLILEEVPTGLLRVLLMRLDNLEQRPIT